ncbi:glycoside hydrolase domain-containing protein [Sunxiuqinia sp. A32]|uniref:glycoside hydrolase domain-containing protein n=1 Tax=Sunxiuqinia sp. A32 TaxID=3461496 RepID=UPI0040465B0B
MRKKELWIIILCIFFNGVYSQNILEKVNLFICTEGDHGQLDPSATVPWGLIKVGPDTDPGNHSGYNYSATKLKGFSHNRIGGTGCNGAGGNLCIVPGIGARLEKSYCFDKSKEQASPGYYSTILKNNVKVELTATNNTAFHKYTFPASDSAFISFNLSSTYAKFINASKTMIGKQEFAVSISAMNVCDVGRYETHFYVRCNKEPIQVMDSLENIVFYFKTRKNEVVNLSVTASTISQDDAKDEWLFTASKLNYDEVLKQAQKKWTSVLSLIEVEGKKEYETIFYTHLYHTLLNPVKSENRNREFKATNGQLYTTQNYAHYDSWSMWDNFRNKFSLYSLILPEISMDICNSLVDLYKYGKPFWSGYLEPVPTVRTEHTIITLLDFYQRGINDFNAELAYNCMCAEINNIHDDTPDTKLEKSYDYWALSEFARLLNKQEDQLLFRDKAMDYKTTWGKFFSTIDETSDIMHAKGLYEGTIWQYRWHVQFDIEGLINLFGTKEEYTNQLEYFFENHLYNHGNQPDIHVPFMFNFGTRPWLTQKWVNKILTKDMFQYYGTHNKWDKPYYGRIYKSVPAGYFPEMDDDEGTMSGWYVLSSLGMYPVEVGKPVFQLTSPIFDKVVIHVRNGKTFEIITKNLDDENFYINSLELNGTQMNRLYLNQDDIINGGKLTIELSDKPNQKLGQIK